jgi:hypothetical protein
LRATSRSTPIDEALREVGYQVRPRPDGGRADLQRQEADWG